MHMSCEICSMSTQILSDRVCDACNFAHISREICSMSARILRDRVRDACDFAHISHEICSMSARIHSDRGCDACNFSHMSREICSMSAQILSLDRPVSQFFQISSFPSSSWVRGWHWKLWTSMGKFYTVRYSGRGYGKGNMGQPLKTGRSKNIPRLEGGFATF